MKISIVTVCRNSAGTIADCMASVKAQTYGDLEHIIVDGDSKDRTLELIKEQSSGISQWISEPDSGIYDAMNKGISLATGEIIGFLNSDDIYADTDILSVVAGIFSENEIDACYGDLLYVSRNDTDKIIRNWKSCELDYQLFKKGWHPPHPTFFVKKSLYQKYGAFDTKYEIAADYALMLKLLYKHRIKAKYIKKVLVKMRTGGNSNASFGNVLRANFECYRAWKEYGLDISPLFILRKPLSKIFQYRI